MELTKKDRLFLANQYEILKHLDADNASTYGVRQEIAERGYAVFYPMLHDHIFDEMQIVEGKFVLDVLDMYRAIWVYLRDHPDDEEVRGQYWAKFHGFSGNDESDYMGFTRFVILTQGKFGEQLEQHPGNDFDSHSPSFEQYQEMKAIWETIPSGFPSGEEGTRFKLTQDQVLSILRAGQPAE